VIIDVKDKVFCLYSEENSWIDALFVCTKSKYEKAKEIVGQAFDDWFDEDDPDAIGDYIRRRLDENGMEGVEIYWK
jgi:hypothetical protein